MSPLDYVVYKDVFYRISQRDMTRLVKLVPSGPERFSRWISEQFQQMRDSRNNREQSRLNNDTNILSFFKEIKQESILVQFLHELGGLHIELDKENRNLRKDEFPKLGDVREAARSAGKMYIPGTSIKGALRTALLYDFLQRNAELSNLESILRNQMNDRRVRKENFAAPLEEMAFFCEQTDDKGRPRKKEAQMDLMKFIAVADALAPEVAKSEVGKINLYLVEKDRTDRNNRGGRLLASKQKQSSYVEMIAAGQELISSLSCDGQALAFLLKKAKVSGNEITVDKVTYYKALKLKLQNLFNLPSELLEQADGATLSAAILQHCTSAMTTFAQAQRKRQKDWQQDYSAQHDPENYADLIAAGYTPVNSYEGNFMHLGYAAGFNATTVLLHFLEDQPHRALYERVMDHFQLGRAPKQTGRYTPNINRFPKSRRMVDTPNRILPLGWVALLGADEPVPVLYSDEQGQTATSSPVLTTIVVPLTAEYYTGKINFKRPPEVDAVVIRSGTPNRIKVYLSPDNCPEVDLQAYRTALPEGSIIRVQVQLNRKGDVLGASFRKMK